MTTTVALDGSAPPTKQALCCVLLAGVEAAGVSAWMATLPVQDSLWMGVPLVLAAFAFSASWRSFRAACFVIGGLLFPLSVLGMFDCWFFLLPAGGFLFLAGGVARPPTPHEAASARPVDWVLRALLAGVLVNSVLSAVWWTINPHEGNTLITSVWMAWPGLVVPLIPFWPRTTERLRVTCTSLAGALPLFALGGLTLGWGPMVFAAPPLLAVAGCTSTRPNVRQYSAALAVVMVGVTTILWCGRLLGPRGVITF
ncbi:hypothetical protein DN069_33290 [Streptacidiphilus pinicola]|uniref:Uncharacterized protein n=1 Tax=Streptacidiphilus pinicola TaxID=2219663 RepID=A0A2X0J1W4_9ACTN|nr:hypothetical protein [Streptacidiphilus pinicola]RAG81368.1 hypothetical protein DN069_33290 [Streptacidiphilus pinicola]